jgi:AcrR family transcriptional regulator
MATNTNAEPAEPTRRLGRTERREQLLMAATSAFARAGFAATSLDDVAAMAGISRVILYRHFESKIDLYRAVLDRACARLDIVGERPGAYTNASVDALLEVAAEDPDAFRLLFHHAAREPQFREEMDRFRAGWTRVAHQQLKLMIPNPAWAHWAARLAPIVTVEAIMAWLDAGQPDRVRAAEGIRQVIAGIVASARQF